MTFFNRNHPPKYDSHRTYAENLDEFSGWAQGLRNPSRSIKSLAEAAGYSSREHSLGFTVVYLSAPVNPYESCTSGVARAHIYPTDREIADDIHSHGFSFESTVIAGDLVHNLHYPDFSRRLPDGEGYVGYETRVDTLGHTTIQQATDATVYIPRDKSIRQELKPGDRYRLGGKNAFHSVAGMGTVTVFCKTPSTDGSNGDSLVLRRPGSSSPQPY